MDLVQATLQTIQRHQLILPHSIILLGVSGGPDSLALLHVLHRLSSRLNFRLHVATLDHQLRGEVGAEDARFVERTAEAWGIPVTARRVDVRQIAQERGIGIEPAARLARYDFLARVAEQVSADRVAVAHHMDDQAETILMHIIRGAGVEGLVGMSLHSAVPGHPQFALIRPFLKVSHAQILDYCETQKLNPRQDATNQDISILRNYIRLETLPHLQKLNPNIRRALVQLADITAVEHEYMERQFQVVLDLHVTVSDGRIRTNREAFRDLHVALQRRFVYWAAQRLSSGTGDTGYSHIVSAVEIGLQGKLGAVALLSGGLRLRVDYEVLVIERSDATFLAHDDIPLLDNEIQVRVPSVTRIPGWSLHSSTQEDMVFQARLDIPEGAEVVLRARRAGDQFVPLGMNGHRQKVGRWMINRKIPRALRDRIPILVVGGEIAAIIVGADWTIGEAFAVNEGSKRVIYLAFEKSER
jgi:tRNA(Ile)-lysidine synthase